MATLNNETVYLPVLVNPVELRDWMKEVTGNAGGWYICSQQNKGFGIVFCRDFGGNREEIKTWVRLKWGCI